MSAEYRSDSCRAYCIRAIRKFLKCESEFMQLKDCEYSYRRIKDVMDEEIKRQGVGRKVKFGLRGGIPSLWTPKTQHVHMHEADCRPLKADIARATIKAFLASDMGKAYVEGGYNEFAALYRVANTAQGRGVKVHWTKGQIVLERR